MKKAFLLSLCILVPSITAAAQQKRVVTAAQANGVYRNRWSEFRVLALGNNKLKVQFNGQYMTRAGYPNIGYAMGEAIIDGNIATFIPNGTRGCEITIVFLPNKLRVEQAGSDSDCGFGHNVMATGMYRKTKGGRPKFTTNP